MAEPENTKTLKCRKLILVKKMPKTKIKYQDSFEKYQNRKMPKIINFNLRKIKCILQFKIRHLLNLIFEISSLFYCALTFELVHFAYIEK